MGSQLWGFVALVITFLSFGWFSPLLKLRPTGSVATTIGVAIGGAVLGSASVGMCAAGMCPMGFSVWGILSAALTGVAWLLSSVAVQLSGIAAANATWASTIMFITFVWSAVIMQRPVGDMSLAIVGLVLLAAGVVLVAMCESLAKLCGERTQAAKPEDAAHVASGKEDATNVSPSSSSISTSPALSEDKHTHPQPHATLELVNVSLHSPKFASGSVRGEEKVSSTRGEMGSGGGVLTGGLHGITVMEEGLAGAVVISTGGKGESAASEESASADKEHAPLHVAEGSKEEGGKGEGGDGGKGGHSTLLSGLGVAVLAGLFGGMTLVPMQMAGELQGLAYNGSFAVGIVLVALAMTLIRQAYRGWVGGEKVDAAARRPDAPLLARLFAGVPPGGAQAIIGPKDSFFWDMATAIGCGLAWGIGNAGSLVGVGELGLAVAGPLTQAGMLMSTVIGIIWFKEIPGTIARLILTVGIVVFGAGTYLLGRFGSPE
jgi:hypothetical protein